MHRAGKLSLPSGPQGVPAISWPRESEKKKEWNKKQEFRPHPLHTKVVSAKASEDEEAVARMDICPLYVVRWWWHQRPCLWYP